MAAIDKNRKCANCGGPVFYNTRTGFCGKNPECMAMAREVGRLARTDTDRKCDNCSGPLFRSNATPFCHATPECTKLSRNFTDRSKGGRKARGPYTGESQRTLARRRQAEREGKKRYDVKAFRLENDGEIDDVAVYLTAHGIRIVALTDEERVASILRMISFGTRPVEMCRRLHINFTQLRGFLADLGWEMIEDPHITHQKCMLLVRKDRNKNKILTSELLDPIPAVRKGKKK